MGNYYLVNEEFNVADEWYSRAIDINPVRFGPIYKNRALARLKSGKGSVKEDLKKYLAIYARGSRPYFDPGCNQRTLMLFSALGANFSLSEMAHGFC